MTQREIDRSIGELIRLTVDPSGGKASYWLTKAANALDCAVQCCGDLEVAGEITAIEERLDELALEAKEAGW